MPLGWATGWKEKEFDEMPPLNNVQHPAVGGNHAPVVGEEGETTPESNCREGGRGRGRFADLGERIKRAVRKNTGRRWKQPERSCGAAVSIGNAKRSLVGAEGRTGRWHKGEVERMIAVVCGLRPGSRGPVTGGWPESP